MFYKSRRGEFFVSSVRKHANEVWSVSYSLNHKYESLHVIESIKTDNQMHISSWEEERVQYFKIVAQKGQQG